MIYIFLGGVIFLGPIYLVIFLGIPAYPCLSKLPKKYRFWSPKYKSPRPPTTNLFVVVVGWEWDPVFMDCDIHQRILTSIITYQPTGVLNTAHLYPFVLVLVFLVVVLVLVVVVVVVVAAVAVAVAVVALRSIIPIPTELADSRGSYCHAPQQQGAPFWWKGTCSQKIKSSSICGGHVVNTLPNTKPNAHWLNIWWFLWIISNWARH